MTSEAAGQSPNPHDGGPAFDATEVGIAQLAQEAFPGIEAVWCEPWTAPPTPGGMSGPWTEISRRILRCGANFSAVTAISADEVLGPAIASQQLFVGVGGSGGVLQAEVLPLQFVQGACTFIAAHGGQLNEDHLIEVAVSNFRKLRSGISGEYFDGWMLTAFRGVNLEPNVPISTPWGHLVHADRMSSDMWLQGGCSAVLATPIRSFLRPSSGDASTWMDCEFRQVGLETGRNAEMVSYGLALGSTTDDPTTAVPIGSGELLPTGMGGHGGAFRSIGFHNRSWPISVNESVDAASWMERLDRMPFGRVDIALRRLVRGLAERVDHLDSLIDAVIAWENLVESRDQPTKSVLFGMAALAGESGWSKKRIGNVYVARSNVIHGEAPDYARSEQFATDALRIGLDALRSLFDNHPDKVEMTSEQRVAALGFIPREG